MTLVLFINHPLLVSVSVWLSAFLLAQGGLWLLAGEFLTHKGEASGTDGPQLWRGFILGVYETSCRRGFQSFHGPWERPDEPLHTHKGCPEGSVTPGLTNLRFRMFLCSSSSAVGLWLSRLRKKSKKSFWTMSYPSGAGDLHGPSRYIRQGQQLESSVHSVF